ncbi:MAG: hypothetical protein JNK92_14425 [Dechloromonas sp.]|nr:hypothetical protein [Dechloromonas sp.]
MKQCCTRRFPTIALAVVSSILLSACASSAIVVGKIRPAIAPEQVKLYLSPPKKYEEVALLESSSRGSFAVTEQGKMNKVVELLKEEAAKIGANGILLRSSGNESGGSVNVGTGTATAVGGTAYGTGIGTSVGIIHKGGTGIAIFVEEE